MPVNNPHLKTDALGGQIRRSLHQTRSNPCDPVAGRQQSGKHRRPYPVRPAKWSLTTPRPVPLASDWVCVPGNYQQLFRSSSHLASTLDVNVAPSHGEPIAQTLTERLSLSSRHLPVSTTPGPSAGERTAAPFSHRRSSRSSNSFLPEGDFLPSDIALEIPLPNESQRPLLTTWMPPKRHAVIDLDQLQHQHPLTIHSTPPTYSRNRGRAPMVRSVLWRRTMATFTILPGPNASPWRFRLGVAASPLTGRPGKFHSNPSR